jgi:uncharacterized NAD(P)/FAD-binding protein YdhS
VIDSLRPYTTAIWMSLTPSEKRRFLRHLFRYWEIIRSRIPPESDALIRQMRRAGQLQILSGKITDIISRHRRLEIRYLARDTDTERSETAAIIINCTGPNLDYGKIDQPLIRNLIRKKVIHPDPAHLGIDALPDGTVIDADGLPSDRIFTIGLTLKGIVWEALATPEIRLQAENLAEKLLHGDRPYPSYINSPA